MGLPHTTDAPSYCSPSHRKAGDRARTGDLNLGKVALYQLSYARTFQNITREAPEVRRGETRERPGPSTSGCPATASGEASQTSGAEQATGGNRTHNPGITNAVLYR